MTNPILTLVIKGMSANGVRKLLDTIVWRTTQINMQANKVIQFKCSHTLFNELLEILIHHMSNQDTATLIKSNEEELLNTYIHHEPKLLKIKNINGRMDVIRKYSPLFKTVETLVGVHT